MIVLHLPPDLMAGIAAACGFTPAVVRMFSTHPTNVAEVTRRGQVSVVVPVPKGHADDVFGDPAVEGALAAGAVVVLAFKAKADARRFARLLKRVHGHPVATHPMPASVQ